MRPLAVGTSPECWRTWTNAPNGRKWPVSLAGTYVGAAAIGAGVFQALQRDWEGFRVEIERLIDGGDSVVAVGRYAATHRRSGKSFEARVAHVWTVEDGRIRRFEQFCDTLLVDRATR